MRVEVWPIMSRSPSLERLPEKRRLIGASTEHINYKAVASVRVVDKFFFVTVKIETSGGSQPIHVHRLRRRHAKEIQAVIRAQQASR